MENQKYPTIQVVVFCWFLFFWGGGFNCEIQDPFDGIHIKNNIFEDDNFFSYSTILFI